MPRPLGTTSLRILAVVRRGRAYGLDIVTRTGLASGTVYPTLGRLRKAGYIRSSWEDQRVAEREGRPRRRYHELTPEGEAALKRGAERIRGLAADLDPDVVGGTA